MVGPGAESRNLLLEKKNFPKAATWAVSCGGGAKALDLLKVPARAWLVDVDCFPPIQKVGSRIGDDSTNAETDCNVKATNA